MYWLSPPQTDEFSKPVACLHKFRINMYLKELHLAAKFYGKWDLDMKINALLDKRAEIAARTKGKSFVDIGALWGTVNEMISSAVKAGATRAAIVDIKDEGHALWSKMTTHLNQLGVTDTEYITDDASRIGLGERIGKFDIVHSSGVIYHLHNPFDYLFNLRDCARDCVIMTSMTVPDKIQTDEGTIDLGDGRFLSTFGLDDSQKRIMDAHFERLGLGPKSMIVTDAQKPLKADGSPNFGPWWWFFTAESLVRLITAAGLNVDVMGETWAGRAHTFICSKT